MSRFRLPSCVYGFGGSAGAVTGFSGFGPPILSFRKGTMMSSRISNRVMRKKKMRN